MVTPEVAMSDLKIGPRFAPPILAPVVVAHTSASPAAAPVPEPSSAPVAALFARTEAPVGNTRVAGSFKPHEAKMSALTAAKPKYESFTAAFASVLGDTAIAELEGAVGHKPIVLIAGDQCTGKGTAAEGVVAALGGANTGTGTVLRALAKENGLSIEQMSAMLSGKSVDVVGADGSTQKLGLKDFPHLGSAEDVDVRLDYRAATAIASSSLQKADGTTIDISVFESRLAGHLGQFLEDLGRNNIVSVYLYAAPRVQAERYLEREVFAPALAAAGVEQGAVLAAKAKAKAVLSALTDDVGLADCLNTLVDAHIPGLDALAAKVAGIAGRDVNDKSRLLGLYGVDYQDRTAFDVVIDTNGKTPAEVKAAILAAVEAKIARGDG
jgi:cytidylate kinase